MWVSGIGFEGGGGEWSCGHVVLSSWYCSSYSLNTALESEVGASATSYQF